MNFIFNFKFFIVLINGFFNTFFYQFIYDFYHYFYFYFQKIHMKLEEGCSVFTKFYLIIFHILYRGIKYVEPNFIVLFHIYIHKKYHYYAIIQILYKINKK